MPVLENKIVLITRSREQSPKEIAMLESEGATAVAFPTIKTRGVESTLEIDAAIQNLDEYNFIIFSSKNSVKFFLDRLKKLNVSIPESCKTVCVGSKTKEYAEWNNLKIDLMPEEFSAKGILNMLASEDMIDKNVLIPSSVIARDELTDGLSKRGAKVNSVAVYDVTIPESKDIANYIDSIKKDKPDAFIFTSPSSFTNYLKLLSIDNIAEYFENSIVIAIGDTTKEALELQSIHNVKVPVEFTVEACVTGLIEHFNSVAAN